MSIEMTEELRALANKYGIHRPEDAQNTYNLSQKIGGLSPEEQANLLRLAGIKFNLTPEIPGYKPRTTAKPKNGNQPLNPEVTEAWVRGVGK